MHNRLALSTVSLSLASLLVLAACSGSVTAGGGDDGDGGTGAAPDPDTSSSSSSGTPGTGGSGATGGTGGSGATGGTGGAGGSGTGGSGGVPVDDFGPPKCDDNLALDDADPYNAAKAIEICKTADGPNAWGLIEAKWTLPDGSAIPAGYEANYALGHGIYDTFGPNVPPRKGDRILGLSNGAARRPNDANYTSPSGGFAKGYTHAAPDGFPKPSPACPGVVSGQPYDGVALEVTLRAPNNALGFAFDFNYYTAEFPSFTCSTFNDSFVALLSPTPAGQSDGNISFDNLGNIISVNNVFLDVCNQPTCGLGAGQLLDTGFENNGATGWLTTTAPINGGDVFTLRFTTYDNGDAIMDSATLVDHFRWTTQPDSVVGTFRPME
ncbi:choice-of-anchor L domain-containing protein [Polyangium sp. 6x1]|uniref:choice-of-anchor L domain-containing protein n=1 Tax=Polyangium sp. 6x1 TaxID=3042689 RepID=UPI002482DC06|nr:choice-of-anchor L domain-containing protein [Polyangium sp. 6x1]MDI1451325.1 choice-of-anchor L domain-containing protein [Polyangium sp. 6x1]